MSRQRLLPDYIAREVESHQIASFQRFAGLGSVIGHSAYHDQIAIRKEGRIAPSKNTAHSSTNVRSLPFMVMRLVVHVLARVNKFSPALVRSSSWTRTPMDASSSSGSPTVGVAQGAKPRDLLSIDGQTICDLRGGTPGRSRGQSPNTRRRSRSRPANSNPHPEPPMDWRSEFNSPAPFLLASLHRNRR